MSKRLHYADAAQAALIAGIDGVANAVRVTLGPKGRNVLIDQPNGQEPIVTKDGVTVARAVEIADRAANLGARLMKAVAGRTNDEIGDGTTTATCLAQEIAHQGIKRVSQGSNPVGVKRGIDKAVDAIVKGLQARSKPVKGKGEIERVASISGNDPEVGKHVAEAIDKVGNDGVILIENGGAETVLEMVDGMEFDRGYSVQAFINDPKHMQCVLENPLICIVPRKLDNANELVPLCEIALKESRSLLLMCDEAMDSALGLMVLNRVQGGFPCCIVRNPGWGDQRAGVIEDIAILTGGQIVSQELTTPLAEVKIELLGSAERVIVSEATTKIIKGAGDRDAILGRVAALKELKKQGKSEFAKEKFQERIAKLTGGICIIKVGGKSETELIERKYRYEDSVNAVRAAISGGLLPGGGTALLRARSFLHNLTGIHGDDERAGVMIIWKALASPIMQIAANAGVSADLVVQKVGKSRSPDYGYNALTGEFGDMFKMGIPDPCQVTVQALINAASVAGTILTAECLIVQEPEAKGANGTV